MGLFAYGLLSPLASATEIPNQQNIGSNKKIKKIAIEGAFATPDLFD